MTISKLFTQQGRRLFVQTFEGHKGRPGLVGGSIAEGEGLVQHESQYSGHKVYTINKIDKDTFDKVGNISVAIRGKYKGKVIGGNGSQSHSTDIHVATNGEGNIDDWVRFTVRKNILEANIDYAGVAPSPKGFFDEGEYDTLAIDNISSTFDRLTAIGLSKDYPLQVSGSASGGTLRLNRLFAQTFEGHKGRPGEIGGSLPESEGSKSEWRKKVSTYTDDNENETTVYKLNTAKNIPENRGDVVIAIKGKNKGTILMSDRVNGGHSQMVYEFDGNDTIDNYVRFKSDGQSELIFNTRYAGSKYDDGEEPALDNIYKALSSLHYYGVPADTKVSILLRKGEWIETTVREPNFVKHNQQLFHSGGTGSGFHGHKGRIGEIGGSAREGTAQSSTIDHRKRVEDITRKLGFPVERVKSTEDEGYLFNVGGQNFRAAGEYDSKTKEINLYDVDQRSDSALEGILAHEIQHDNYKRYGEAYQKQFVEINRQAQELGWERNKEWIVKADGSIRNPADRKKYWAYDIHENYFSLNSDNWKSLEALDGVSEYSIAYWRQAVSSGSAYDYDRAVDETLAEIARFEVQDNPPPIAPVWKDLYKKVKRG